ncbi:unnamed protein product [Arabidopsis halleri]
MLIGGFEDRNASDTVIAASKKLLEKCGVFDLKGCTLGLQARICNKRSPCPVLVFLYATLGLHRYNLLQGTKFQLSRVKKYVFSTGAAAASYYITLDAIDPAGSSSLQTFQTKVTEDSFGEFILTCNSARIRGETCNVYVGLNIGCRLPECPPENPFELYYLMKDSELQDNNDWIRLYLELAVATTDRNREASDFGLSNLEIVNVAIDAEGLYARNATFYIRYKDLYKARLGKADFDRFAIVRRIFDEDTGLFTLVGQNQSSDFIPKKRKIAANEEDTRCTGQSQSSEIIQCGRGFGVFKPLAENKRIKLNLTGLADQISSSQATCEDHEACKSADCELDG